MEQARILLEEIYQKFRLLVFIELGDTILWTKKYFIWIATKRHRHKLEWVVLFDYMVKLMRERCVSMAQIAKMMGTPELFPYISRTIMPTYKLGTSGFKLRKALKDSYGLLDRQAIPALTLCEFIAEQGVIHGITPRLVTEIPYEIEVYREWDAIYNEAHIQSLFTFEGVVPVVGCTAFIRLVDTLI